MMRERQAEVGQRICENMRVTRDNLRDDVRGNAKKALVEREN